ncbi:MAG: hypothetical protein JNN00_00980 [Chitinophagaceae bacterium]|nr:hypothetical protein [Chitinophagaceae bacterium]
MRKSVLSLALLAAMLPAFSQNTIEEDLKKLRKKRVTNYVVTGSLVMLAGAADGVNQALQFQYPGFKKAFPNANDQFWKPALSGANKYKNGDPKQGAKFPGSRTWLVFTTDGYHLTRFADHLFLSGAVAFKIAGYEKKKWYIYIAEAAGYWLINRAGFCMTYNRFKCYP